MSKQPSVTLKEIIIHMVVWTLYISFAISVQLHLSKKVFPFVYESVGYYLINVGVFYLHSLVILPRLLGHQKYVLYGVAAIGMLSVVVLFRYVISSQLLPHLLPSRPPQQPFIPMFLKALWGWFQFMLYSMGYWLLNSLIQREKELHNTQMDLARQETENLILKQQQLLVQNEILKAQVNPHFLFNTLGYFYNKLCKPYPAIAQGIIALTNIMRSSLQYQQEQEDISIEEEAENIAHLIYIYQLCYAGAVRISLDTSLESGHYPVTPNILVTIIDSVISNINFDAGHDEVNISLQESNHQLTLSIAASRALIQQNILLESKMNQLKDYLVTLYGEHCFFIYEEHNRRYRICLNIQTHPSPTLSTPHSLSYANYQ